MKLMDFATYKDINDHKPNYREMEDATVVSNYRNTGCGDGYRIYLKINSSNQVVDASYTTTGCGFGVVALEMATKYAKNKSIEDLKKITTQDIENLFEFPDRRKNYPESAVSAIKQAVSDFETGNGIPKEKRITKERAFQILEEKGNLSEVDLSNIILEKENLSNINFQNSNLSHAFLQNANLQNANLSGVNLRGSFLNNADLRNANFEGADLRWAKLAGAKLDGANFMNAKYDIGTRVDQNQIHIFDQMIKEGKDIYLKKVD